MMSFQDRPAKKMHEEAGGQHQDRRAQVGLLGDEPHRQQQDERMATRKSRTRSMPSRLLEVPGQHQRHGDLHDLRGLDAREADVEPAPRALRDVAEQRHANQQQHAQDVERQRQLHQALRRNAAPPATSPRRPRPC
jgi:hypothetical protein